MTEKQTTSGPGGGVRTLWKEFLEETSLHGCKEIADSNSNVLRRFLWTICVLFMVGFLLFYLVVYCITYYEYKVVTSTKIHQTDSLPFPAVTICDTCSFNSQTSPNNEKVKQFMTAFSTLRYMSDPERSSASNTEDKTTVTQLRPRNASDFFLAVSWEGKLLSVNNVSSFKPVMTEVGVCYTFNAFSSSEDWKQLVSHHLGYYSGLEVTMKMNGDDCVLQGTGSVGVRVFVHDPKEGAETVIGGIAVAPKTATYITITPTLYSFQPAPYKSYGDSYCQDTSYPNFPLDYSRQKCLRALGAKRAAEACGCRGVLESDHLPQPDCTLKQTEDCYIGANLKAYEALITSDVCPRPCTYMMYNTQSSRDHFPSESALDLITNYTARQLDVTPSTELKDSIRRNVARVVVYFETFQTTQIIYSPETTENGILRPVCKQFSIYDSRKQILGRERTEYEILKCTGVLGGQMGFFLGASVLTVLGVIETVLMSLWILVKKVANSFTFRRQTVTKVKDVTY